jgi:cyclopropane-fatty-acyl-phospholipid synthase
MSLEEAQMAKIDLALGKLGLQPGMTLLDIGCGWGAAMMRAVEKYDVNVIGLTLSHNQMEHIERLFAESDSPRRKEVRLQPWEEYNEPVDRIVSIGAFEHFGFGKYDDYFKKTYNLMPDDGVMLLHTIVIPSDEEVRARKLPLKMSTVRFIKFILDDLSWSSSGTRGTGHGEGRQGRVRGHQSSAAAAALHPHPGHLGGKPRVQEG